MEDAFQAEATFPYWCAGLIQGWYAERRINQQSRQCEEVLSDGSCGNRGGVMSALESAHGEVQ